MNPLERNQTPPSPQQEVQAAVQVSDSVAQDSSSLQANIANINAASSSQQPATVPFQSVASGSQLALYPDLVHFRDGDLFYVLDILRSQVTTVLLEQNLILAAQRMSHFAGMSAHVKAQMINSMKVQMKLHRDLLNGIHIPVFKYSLNINYILPKDRARLHDFLIAVFKRLEEQDCNYDRAAFISMLLKTADSHYLNYQNVEDLEIILDTYIPHCGQNKYLKKEWELDWPNCQEVRKNQDPKKAFATSVTPQIKKEIFLKMKALEDAADQQPDSQLIKKVCYIEAAFAYCAAPGAIRFWVAEGKKLHAAQMAEQALEVTRQIPPVQVQPQALAFRPAQLVDDGQIPGPSRGSRMRTSLRFDPYQRQQEAPLTPAIIQARAATLGLSTEAFQGVRIGEALTPEFNAQMAALAWPVVTTDHFVQEGARLVISPTMRREIGQFIIGTCDADDRVYRHAALRYGVSLEDTVRWASEASE